MTLNFVAILVLIVAAGAACWYAGWRSAAAYLPAARAVAEVSNAAIESANSYSVTLEAVRSEMKSLKNATEISTATQAERSKALEDALQALFAGLERAGLARAPRAHARQVGEAADS